MNKDYKQYILLKKLDCRIHGETSVMESLFGTVAGLCMTFYEKQDFMAVIYG